LGANPTPLAFPEVYSALQLGVVDGQENPFGVIAANRFYEVADYLILTEHLVGFMLLVMSNDRFESLDSDLQDAILQAADDARVYNDQVLEEQSAEWEAVLFESMEVMRPDMEPWREAAQNVYQQFTRHEGFEELYRAIVEVGEE
jgi:TRAP-type C4-dicarboxylate transport system substrate-binding protein